MIDLCDGVPILHRPWIYMCLHLIPPPKPNISPEKCWLDCYVPFEINGINGPFWGEMLISGWGGEIIRNNYEAQFQVGRIRSFIIDSSTSYAKV